MHLKTGYSFNKLLNQMRRLKQQLCKIFHQWKIEKLNFRLSKLTSQKIQKHCNSTEIDGLLEITILQELILELSKNERMKRFLLIFRISH